MTRFLLAIDQGTTSSRAIAFDEGARPVAIAQRAYPQIYPQPGWVEHDAEAIWETTLAVTREAIAAGTPHAIGITNQRETIVLWDRTTGHPLHNAIVWQDRRTADLCTRMVADGLEPMITQRTGLLLDPYFSATKIAWLLDHIPGARARAERGELACGTIDTFLLWRLTGGRVHATDWTNASRTLLFDITTRAWDAELLRLFSIPPALLPEVHPNAHIFGESDRSVLGVSLPIAGMAGDQQAALIGQGCFAEGEAKATYGTGCFLLMNCGDTPKPSRHRLLTTPAYEIGDNRAYALEGSIFIAGAAVKWLRDGLSLFADSAETEAMARRARPDHGISVIPAFVGLGAPHWRADVRGAITGLSLDTGAEELVRATLESIVYQTADLVSAMRADGARGKGALRVDGGMANNGWFVQDLADMLNLTVDQPANHEVTALGAAALAGITTGMFADMNDFAQACQARTRFTPMLPAPERAARMDRWHGALARLLADIPDETHTTHPASPPDHQT